MADENKVTVLIVADAAEAQKVIDKFGKAAEKSLGNAEKSANSLGSAISQLSGAGIAKLAALAGGFAAISKGIDEAVDSEKGLRRLSLAIAATGEFSEKAITELQGFAENLSNLTGIEDDAIISNLTLAKSFGITNDQAKKLVDAAADLSAITGDDLESSVRQLGGTFDGTIGKLGRLGPAFRNLTAEQLQNGEVIKLVTQQYGDAAEALGSGFEGSLNRTTNAFKDALKEIGIAIINDGGVLSGLQTLTDILKGIAPIVSTVTKVFLNGFKAIAGSIAFVLSDLVSFVSFLGKISPLNFGGIKKEADELAEKLDNFGYTAYASFDQAETGSNSFEKSLQRTNDSAKSTGKTLGKLGEDAQKFIDQISSEFASNAEKEAAKLTQIMIKLTEFEKKGAIDTQKAYELRSKLVADFYEKRVKEDDEAYQKQLDIAKKYADDTARQMQEARQKIESLAASPIKILVEGELSGENIGASLAGAFDNILSGKAGAKSAVQGAASLIGDSIAPGLGPVFGSIAGKLAEGPEAVKAQIKEFFDALPDIIIAVVEALPEAIATIIEKITQPEFLARLGFALGKGFLTIFTAGLTTFAPKWGAEIAKAFLPALNSVGQTLSNIFKPILNAFNAIKDAFKPLADGLNSVRDALYAIIGPIEKLTNALGLGGGGGGVGGFFQSVGESLGFSKGGIVPLYAAGGAFVPRGTDTVPAMLTPGERVLSVDQNQDIIAMNQNNTAMLSAILGLLSQPQVVNVEAKVNQKAFADIILQLNRQNQRLSA